MPRIFVFVEGAGSSVIVFCADLFPENGCRFPVDGGGHPFIPSPNLGYKILHAFSDLGVVRVNLRDVPQRYDSTIKSLRSASAPYPRLISNNAGRPVDLAFYGAE